MFTLLLVLGFVVMFWWVFAIITGIVVLGIAGWLLARHLPSASHTTIACQVAPKAPSPQGICTRMEAITSPEFVLTPRHSPLHLDQTWSSTAYLYCEALLFDQRLSVDCHH